jgi:hypothetical protein
LNIFKDCVEEVKQCHPCQIISKQMLVHPNPFFPIITIDPFTKWGIDFMTYHSASTRGNYYIIMVVDYFMKWAEAIPTFMNDDETSTLFIFNQIISSFGVLREIVIDHNKHFHNLIMT